MKDILSTCLMKLQIFFLVVLTLFLYNFLNFMLTG